MTNDEWRMTKPLSSLRFRNSLDIRHWDFVIEEAGGHDCFPVPQTGAGHAASHRQPPHPPGAVRGPLRRPDRLDPQPRRPELRPPRLPAGPRGPGLQVGPGGPPSAGPPHRTLAPFALVG